MGFDGNATYRHSDIAELRDVTEEDPKELEASKYDLNYIALEGEIWLYGKRCWPSNGHYGHH